MTQRYPRMCMRTLLFYLLTMLLISCEGLFPKAPPDDQILDGPVKGLNEAENLLFLRGDKAFNDKVFTSENGLGPLFVATSCGSCHPGDGKGHPFTTLTRFGQVDEGRTSTPTPGHSGVRS